MIVSFRIHVLLYGFMLVWGTVELVRTATGSASLITMLLGVAYLAVAGYQLCSGPGSHTPGPAVQRVR